MPMHRSLLHRLGLGLAAAATFLATNIASGQIFTFDVDVAGWSVFDIGYYGQPLNDPQPVNSVSFDAVNGLPPGSLRVSDRANETWIGATAAVMGDRSALYGIASLSYDVLYRYRDEDNYAAVALYGAGLTVYQAHEPPELNVWLHKDYPIVAGAWRVGNRSGPVATEAELRALLADLRGVFIHTEWRTGPDDTNVDNIRLGCTGSITPARRIMCPRGSATFSVVPVATATTSYQWQLEVQPNQWITLLSTPVALPGGGQADANPADDSQTTITVRARTGRFRVRCNMLNVCGAAVSVADLSVCGADFDCSGTYNLDDVFIYLAAWFTGDPRCDVDNANGVNADDLFLFLDIWFAGC